jgi:hypothetical protein
VNIFVLDAVPDHAARALCDKHVPKMVLETAQLLCSVWPAGDAPYRRTHYNHPCAQWTRASAENFTWLSLYGAAVADEYTFRFGRIHASASVIQWCAERVGVLGLSGRGRTEFAQAMPPQYRIPGDPVAAYRAYYRGEKARFCAWKRGRTYPAWWVGAG